MKKLIKWINWMKKNLGPYKIQRTVLTNPCLSLMLLVSLSLWNDTTFCIHCSPVDGLSGWMLLNNNERKNNCIGKIGNALAGLDATSSGLTIANTYYIRFGISGSALPATIHRLQKLERSTKTKFINDTEQGEWNKYISIRASVKKTRGVNILLFTFINFFVSGLLRR